VKTLGYGSIFTVLIAAVVLTGCSPKQQPGTSTEEQRESQSASSAPAAATPDNRPLIVAFGDSLTAGVVDKTYPEFLQQILDQHNYRFRVENQGVAGDTTSDGLARIDNVTAEHPAIVLLEFGGNDGLRGLPVESTRHNLEAMIQKLNTPPAQVLLLGITLPPNYGADYIKPFNAMYTDLAHQYHLPLLPFLIAHVYADKNLMQPDGIHPNDSGNKVVAEDVFHFLEPQLRRLQPR
jgi:acyl-CoA thioesterase I